MSSEMANKINVLLETLPYIIFILGLFLIVLGLYKKERLSVYNKFFLKIVFIKLYEVLYFIVKPRSEKRITRLNKDLKLVHKKFSVQHYYLTKIICACIVTVLLVSIFYTNKIEQTKQTIEGTSTVSLVDLEQSAELEYIRSISPQVFKRMEKMFYNSIKDNYTNFNDIYKMDESLAVLQLTDFLEIEFEDIEIDYGITAGRMYKKIKKIQMYQFEPKYYLIIFLGYLFPNLILFGLRKYQDMKYKNDIPILKISTYLLGSMDTTVKEILTSLQICSKAYSPVINKCLKNYNAVKYDKSKAVMDMTEEVQDAQFRKLCVTLKDCISSSKIRAIEALEEDMIMEDKEDMMRSEAKIESRTAWAIVMIAPCMLFLALLLLRPFTKIYNQVGM